MTKSESELSDFSEFYLSESSVLELEFPNGDPMVYQGQQVRVHVFGPSTTQYVKAKEALDREATKRVVSAMGRKNGKKDDEDRDADIKFLLAITERFENFPYPGGADAIYREPRLKYIAEQVRSFVGDLGNFFRNGKTP
ncbi:MAG: hypothetical protein LV471_11105 [Nitrosomonas sp.]|nr:hypothetical protein [Nitrosomonas sp.]